MVQRLMSFMLFSAFFTYCAYASQVSLCEGRIRIDSPTPIELTESEVRLVCGGGQARAWRDIPLKQAAYFLEVFYIDRGYHKAEAVIEGSQLLVRTGPQILVREVTFNFDSVIDPSARQLLIGIDVSRYWPIIGRPMTPKALDELKRWIGKELSERGMPCGTLSIQANPATGIVAIEVTDARVFSVPPVTADTIPGVSGEIQKRYYAFGEGDRYNSLELDLSARRLVQEDIVVSSNFITRCSVDEESIEIEQQMVAGDPRLVSFGVGFDTEEYAIAEATWRHARFGLYASNVSASLKASFRRQALIFGYDWYYAPIMVRHFLRTTIAQDRINERQEDSRTSEGRFGGVWHLDVHDYMLEAFAGTAFRHIETERGVGPRTSDSLMGVFSGRLMSHEFEYFAAEPRTGHEFSFELNRAKKGLGSDVSFLRYLLKATALWTIFALDPPVWILGVRASAASTTLDQDTTLRELPITLRNFLGGTKDMRGFGRRAVPSTDEGALTTLYMGAEMRVREVIPYNVHPFIFVDYGKVGGDGTTVTRDAFWSLGAGTQWQSPIGTLRTTLAHGFVGGPNADRFDRLSRWQFYLNFGEQF